MNNFRDDSVKGKLYAYLEGRGWVSGSELEDLSDQWQRKASNVDRRLRQLAEDSYLESKLVKGCVWYKKIGARVVKVPSDGSLSERVYFKADQEVLFEFETAPPRFNANPELKAK